MDIRELNIGDFVKVKDTGKIGKITAMIKGKYQEPQIDVDSEEKELDEIEPVPYTKELHEKIWGKKLKVEGEYSPIFICPSGAGSVNKLSFHIESYSTIQKMVYVKDLHFLQNFLRGIGEYELLDKIENMTL